PTSLGMAFGEVPTSLGMAFGEVPTSLGMAFGEVPTSLGMAFGEVPIISAIVYNFINTRIANNSNIAYNYYLLLLKVVLERRINYRKGEADAVFNLTCLETASLPINTEKTRLS
ncbi:MULTISPECIES: hypothetical protein, partial [unclassified Microcystis]